MNATVMGGGGGGGGGGGHENAASVGSGSGRQQTPTGTTGTTAALDKPAWGKPSGGSGVQDGGASDSGNGDKATGTVAALAAVKPVTWPTLGDAKNPDLKPEFVPASTGANANASGGGGKKKGGQGAKSGQGSGDNRSNAGRGGGRGGQGGGRGGGRGGGAGGRGGQGHNNAAWGRNNNQQPQSGRAYAYGEGRPGRGAGRGGGNKNNYNNGDGSGHNASHFAQHAPYDTGFYMARGGGSGGGGAHMYYQPQHVAAMQHNAQASQMPQREQILAAVKQQVEYYFSVENLCKDLFLRSKMDPVEGWISLSVIASFNRIRMMTPEPAMVYEALVGSTTVEISQEKDKIRKMGDWKSWLMDADATARAAAQNEITDKMSKASVDAAPAAASMPKSTEKKSSKSKLKKDEDEMFEMDEDFGEDEDEDDDDDDDDDETPEISLDDYLARIRKQVRHYVHEQLQDKRERGIVTKAECKKLEEKVVEKILDNSGGVNDTSKAFMTSKRKEKIKNLIGAYCQSTVNARKKSKHSQ